MWHREWLHLRNMVLPAPQSQPRVPEAWRRKTLVCSHQKSKSLYGQQQSQGLHYSNSPWGSCSVQMIGELPALLTSRWIPQAWVSICLGGHLWNPSRAEPWPLPVQHPRMELGWLGFLWLWVHRNDFPHLYQESWRTMLITVSLGLISAGNEWVGRDIQHWMGRGSLSVQEYPTARLTLFCSHLI